MPLEVQDQTFFFQLSACGQSHRVTSSLTRAWDCLLWICLAVFKCTYRTYSMYGKININKIRIKELNSSKNKISLVITITSNIVTVLGNTTIAIQILFWCRETLCTISAHNPSSKAAIYCSFVIQSGAYCIYQIVMTMERRWVLVVTLHDYEIKIYK
jgi:hypothetical protein